MPLYCDEVYACVKLSQHPITAKTIARKLGLARNTITASLHFAAKYFHKDLTMTLRNPLNHKKKRPIWSIALEHAQEH
jgi:hypothetical protein